MVITLLKWHAYVHEKLNPVSWRPNSIIGRLLHPIPNPMIPAAIPLPVAVKKALNSNTTDRIADMLTHLVIHLLQCGIKLYRDVDDNAKDVDQESE